MNKQQQIMRPLIIILLLLPVFALSQKTDVLIKLIDSRNQQIRGEATLKGFEKWIAAIAVTSGGKNNTQFSFTMTVNGSSADLKRAMTNGESLLSGQVTVLAPNQSFGAPTISYTVKMERVAVSACFEAMGCNSAMNTTVTLQATRIGWTYYTTSGTGAQTVSRKYGWDAESGKEWSAF